MQYVYVYYTIYVEMFVGEIFRGLNFLGIIFSWLKPPTKTVCSIDKTSCCWRNAALREREPRNTHDRYAVAVEKDGTVMDDNGRVKESWPRGSGSLSTGHI